MNLKNITMEKFDIYKREIEEILGAIYKDYIQNEIGKLDSQNSNLISDQRTYIEENTKQIKELINKLDDKLDKSQFEENFNIMNSINSDIEIIKVETEEVKANNERINKIGILALLILSLIFVAIIYLILSK